MAALGQPCEVAGGCRGEDLRHGLLVAVGDVPVVEEEIAAHVLAFAVSCPLRPLVIFTGVVHDKVHANLNALFMAGFGQSFQILHGTECRLNLAEVLHGIAAVAALGNCVQEGHQVDVVDIALLQVGQLFFDAVDGAAEIVDVEHHAHQIIAAVPVGIGLFFAVDGLQTGAALFVEFP